jgi:hypothetical protein
MAARRGTRKTEAERRWRRLVAEQEASGLSARAFSRRHGLAEGTLAWWRSELRRRGAERRSREAPPVLAPVRLVGEAPPAPAGEFTVELAGGQRLYVSAGFDADALRRLLDVLEARPC